MEKEIWLPIKEYENLYEISNLGRIKSLIKKEVQQKNQKNGFDVNTGYINVQLRKIISL